jgi:hypothetical protein
LPLLPNVSLLYSFLTSIITCPCYRTLTLHFCLRLVPLIYRYGAPTRRSRMRRA